MSLKRTQQAQFQAAMLVNKFPGSGGGSGMLPLLRLGIGNENTAVTETSTTPTVVGACSVTVTLSRSSFLYVIVYSIGKTTGAGGNFAYGAINSDGGVGGFNYTTTGANNMCLWDKGNGGYTPNYQYILSWYAPGSHTLDFRVAVDAGQTWTNYISMIDVLQVAA